MPSQGSLKLETSSSSPSESAFALGYAMGLAPYASVHHLGADPGLALGLAFAPHLVLTPGVAPGPAGPLLSLAPVFPPATVLGPAARSTLA